MSRYEFPILSLAEIASSCTDLEICNISQSHLLRPNYDVVSNLYTALLIYIDPAQEDNDQMDFEALDRLENPDHHVTSVRVLNLLDKIREVVDLLGCPLELTLKDLIAPNPERTHKFLSVLLNYCIYKQSKIVLLQPHVDELSKLEEKRINMEDKLTELTEEISKYKELRESEMPEVQELEAKLKELRQTIHGLNSHQMSVTSNLRTIKKKVKEMDEKIQNAEFALITSVQENGSLQSKIVQSPDKLQSALDEKKSLKAEAKNAENMAMQSFHDKTAVLEIYTKASTKLSKQLTLMKATQDQVNSAKTIEKDLKVLKSKMSDQDLLNKSLGAKLVELQTKADQLDELKKQLENESVQRRELVNKELNNVRSEVEAKRRDLEARQKQVEAAVTEADSINTEINKVKESGAAKVQEIGRLCEAITEKFLEYSNNINATWNQSGHGRSSG